MSSVEDGRAVDKSWISLEGGRRAENFAVGCPNGDETVLKTSNISLSTMEEYLSETVANVGREIPAHVSIRYQLRMVPTIRELKRQLLDHQLKSRMSEDEKEKCIHHGTIQLIELELKNRRSQFLYSKFV